MSLLSTSGMQWVEAIGRVGRQQHATGRGAVGLAAGDAPAGLLTVSPVQAQAAWLQSAAESTQRADAMLATAGRALDEVGNLLIEIETLTSALASDGGLGVNERSVMQTQIDAAVGAVARTLGSARFNGRPIFGGDHAYRTAGIDMTELTDVTIYAADRPMRVTVDVDAPATPAWLTYSGQGLAAEGAQLRVRGELGSQTVVLPGSASMGAIANALRAIGEMTGVSAVASGGRLHVTSTRRGSDAWVSVEALEGEFDTVDGRTSAHGQDATVRVNGTAAQVSGQWVTADADGVSVSFRVSDALNVAGATSTFRVDGGGANLWTGPAATDVRSVGLPRMTPAGLGSAGDGYLAEIIGGGRLAAMANPSAARAVVAAARQQASQLSIHVAGTRRDLEASAGLSTASMFGPSPGGQSSRVTGAGVGQMLAAQTRSQMLMRSASAAFSFVNASGRSLMELLYGDQLSVFP